LNCRPVSSAARKPQSKLFSQRHYPPTINLLSFSAPPLSEICRFIAFFTMKEQIKAVAQYLRFIKPEILEEISESGYPHISSKFSSDHIREVPHLLYVTLVSVRSGYALADN
jgi:hypothetical protein